MHHYHSNQLSNRSKEIESFYSNKLISSERISNRSNEIKIRAKEQVNRLNKLINCMEMILIFLSNK